MMVSNQPKEIKFVLPRQLIKAASSKVKLHGHKRQLFPEEKAQFAFNGKKKKKHKKDTHDVLLNKDIDIKQSDITPTIEKKGELKEDTTAKSKRSSDAIEDILQINKKAKREENNKQHNASIDNKEKQPLFTQSRTCSKCNKNLQRDDYSKNQWKKGLIAKCKGCIALSQQPNLKVDESAAVETKVESKEVNVQQKGIEETKQTAEKKEKKEKKEKQQNDKETTNSNSSKKKEKQQKVQESTNSSKKKTEELETLTEKMKVGKSSETVPDSSNYSLVRSVNDAVKDGGRPRSNSTDCELNLPQRGLCDESVILQSLSWDVQRLYKGSSKSPPPRGMYNLGNTCFMNATLQCLVHVPPFSQSIAALPGTSYQRKGKKNLAHGGQLITMLLRGVTRMAHGIVALEKNEPPKTNAITPKTIHKAITTRKTNGYNFRPGRQEDAHELLVHLLDQMHEGELNAAGINPQASGWRDRLPLPRLDETTFIHRIFGGYLRSQLKCNKCGYKSNTYDPFLDLALEVSKKHIDSLSSAFREFTQKETLDSNNRWKCSGCKKNVCPTKHLSIFRPPLSLCITLKRFEFGKGGGGGMKGWGWGFGHRNNKGYKNGNGGSKIQKKIHFPAHMSLPLSDGRICQYELNGMIVHVGSSATTGHYTSFVKRPGNNQWCYMDDSHVERVSEQTVLKQRDAYVLFYTRKEVGKSEKQQRPSGGKKRKRPHSSSF